MRKNLIKTLAIAIVVSVSMGTSASAAPSEIYGHKTVKAWDYHHTNYDENGNIRYQPSTTTFETVKEPKEVDSRIPNLSSNDTLCGEDVEINFDNSGEWKSWSNNIYKVVKADIKSNNPNLEKDVIFSIKDNKIVLDKQSKAINYNDKIKIKIYSEGYEAVEHIIHIVKHAPKIMINPDFKPTVGQDILFELKNFDYGVVNPIYEVVLDGKVLKGNCNDYHIISNLVRIERGGVIKTPGKHTIVIKAIGFKDAVKQFIVEDSKNGYKNSNIDNNKKGNTSSDKRIITKIKNKDKDKEEVDGTTSASLSKGSKSEKNRDKKKVDGMTSASVSEEMNANLVFDFDLLSNAYILKSLGIETKESKKVIEIWENSLKDGAFSRTSKKAVDWSAFTNAVLDAKLNGQHLTFDEYINSDKSEEFTDKLYNVKYVLEDGLLGETQLFEEVKSKESPSVNVSNTFKGQDVILTFKSDNEWEKAISDLNIGYKTLNKSEYTIKNGQIIINSKNFNLEENNICIKANGFKTVSTKVFIKNKDIDVKVSGTWNAGESVEIINLSKDYIKNINSIKLNGKSLLSELQGSSSGSYKIDSEKIILNGELFKESGRKVLTINSYGYEDKIITFDIAEQSSNSPSEVKPEEKPEVKIEIKQETKLEEKPEVKKLSDGVVIKFSPNNWSYNMLINAVMVNDKSLENGSYENDGNGELKIPNEFLKEGKNKITIKAPMNKDVVLNVNIEKNNSESEVKPETKPETKPEMKPEIKTEDKVKPEIKPETKPKIKIEIKQETKLEEKPEVKKLSDGVVIKFSPNNWSYNMLINAVMVNDKSLENGSYENDGNGELKIPNEFLKEGKNKITVKASMNKDVVLNVNIEKNNSESEVKPETKPETKPEIKPEVKTEDEVKPEIKPETKPKIKIEIKQETKLEEKPEVKKLSDGVVIKFSPNNYAYNMLINEVMVNGKSLENGSYENDGNGELKIPNEFLKEGKNKITVKATMNKDVVLNVNIDKDSSASKIKSEEKIKDEVKPEIKPEVKTEDKVKPEIKLIEK